MKLVLDMRIFAILAVMLFTSIGINNASAQDRPEFSGTWDFTFYGPSGKVEGLRTLTIYENGSISAKANMYLGTIVYLTEIEGDVSSNGVLNDGTLTDHDRIDIVGTMSGKFTVDEGSGVWNDYHENSGTWKAVRSEKKTKY